MKMIKTIHLFLFCFCQEETLNADFTFSNANGWTENDKQIPAQSMTVVGDFILANGSNDNILNI